ncbi:MAG: Do family serine endopeptidase [Aureliella sp.]
MNITKTAELDRSSSRTRLMSRRSIIWSVGGLSLIAAITAGMLPLGNGPSTSAAYAQQTAEANAARQQLLIGADRLSEAFRLAAQSLRPSVVTITSLTNQRVRRNVRRNFSSPFGSGFGDLDPFRGMLPDDLLEELQRGGARNGRFFDEYEEDLVPEGEQSSRQVQTGMGSGFIVSTDGYILTNNHVVERADRLQVDLSDGRSFEADVVGTDPQSDVALLKIDAPNLVAARIGDSDAMQVGDWVIAIGSPFGLDQTVTAGIISATNRSTGILKGGFEDFLQTDAAINPGNSGGPLVNLRGEVVGINTAINSRTGTNVGVGFAIPASMASSIMQDLKTGDGVQRGYIGAMLRDVNLQNADEFQLPRGVVRGASVEVVQKGGPADRASLQVGDVITQVNGKPVTSSNQIVNAVARMRPNSQLRFQGYRDGRPIDIDITTGVRDEERLSQILPSAEIERLGIGVQNLSPRQKRESNAESGVVVSEMDTRRRAYAEGVRPGDIIVEAAGQPVTDANVAKKLLSDPSTSQIIIQRGNRLLSLELENR